ncbi:hypothetical protein [Taklimakanibacter lacteus]|uniref:hypothetical protein n=1 Tax=Taklimakanibacter lacteus TaxID=2268456 RepID=UPI000E66E00B
MVEVKRITSTAEITQGEKYVLVQYGDKKLDSRHSRGHTLTIESRHKPDALKQVEFHTAIDGAKRLAKDEGIKTVYVLDHPDSD